MNEQEKEKLFSEIADAILDGRHIESEKLAKRALEIGIDPLEAIDKGCSPAMNKAGEKHSEGEYFVPELMLCARAMKTALNVFLPHLKGKVEGKGRIVIGTVEGDIHDIGKSLVATLLQTAGYEVIDMGVDVPRDKFIDAVRDYKPDILAMSALITTTMDEMHRVIDGLKDVGLRDKVKVMIGGAPITDEFAKVIGADAFGDNADEAIRISKELIKR